MQCVLMFHGIGQIPGHVVPEERRYWITWDFFDEIVEYVRKQPAEREILFTFDDGNASDLGAARKLAEADLDGIFFILAGRIGQPDYLDEKAIAEMRSLGMRVGLHGRDHLDWRSLSDSDLEDELVSARAEIAAISGSSLDTVAIPFGAYNRSVMRRLKSDDFNRIYTSDPGMARRSDRIVRRNTVKAEHSLADVIDMINDRISFTKKVRRAIAPPIKRMID